MQQPIVQPDIPDEFQRQKQIQRNQAIIAMLNAWEQEDLQEDPQTLGEELESFLKAINRS